MFVHLILTPPSHSLPHLSLFDATKIWESDANITALFDKCYFSKAVDVVKVVLNATVAQAHGLRLHQLADQWRQAHPGKEIYRKGKGRGGRKRKGGRNERDLKLRDGKRKREAKGY
jgi:hypothetical protein